VREEFAVEALVDLAPDTDVAAIGGAVTLALCGAFEHPGPCPLAPHRTSTEPGEHGVLARVVGVCDPGRRATVVAAVIAALQAGSVVDPAGVRRRWDLRSCRVTELRDEERALAERLARG